MLGYSAAAVSCVQLVPQVVRTVRTRVTAGVSPLMWSLLGAQSGAWIVFGASRRLWPSALVNVVLAGCVAMMLATMRRLRTPGLGRAVAVMAALMAVEAALIGTGAMPVLGSLAGLIAALVFYPQVLVALRATDLSGLSRTSWLFAVVTSVQWAAYGVATGTPVVWVSAAHNLILASVVLARLYVFAPRSAALDSVAAA